MIFIGAEEIISPLGQNIEENFQAVCENRSGISLIPHAGFNDDSMHLSKITAISDRNKFEMLLINILEKVLKQIDPEIALSKKTITIVSSTKGDLDRNISSPFTDSINAFARHFQLANEPVVVSNACISGVLAINVAGNFIKAGMYDHAIVLGCDLISNFVLFGFQSLFAVSNAPCAPFDADRNGITLGEGCSAVVLSNSKEIFKKTAFQLYTGTSANDANHISGPSRTGEGLFRSVKKTLEQNHISGNEIDFISAHGTATVFNDEMEAIAFDRLEINEKPLNSLKGYFGHTLGAAGVIETAISMQMMRNNLLVKSLGFKESGTSKTLNIATENKSSELNTILKTASGFGGCNASLVIRKL
ncbi:beta-ketoacyl synthase N-terminal-like domain-containing protein [Dyadobacter sp. CY356]|uniref:beta-ketoacyl synthase N-terminal-like domain-containing protein n=1 Tax=Dyadobacter sp. CY356 TaxID=2906442 RepID=UPI001F39B886|nr:beta-ketoacyl synthase N-terminal-like domain-containing protein [Dyadobacter sp. CY356]MCF0056435.1 beta-ketoacyl synthase [Dyadobacter sp. CY356]